MIIGQQEVVKETLMDQKAAEIAEQVKEQLTQYEKRFVSEREEMKARMQAQNESLSLDKDSLEFDDAYCDDEFY
eukprot:CAMPEP_0170494122 /NCGR_PEP_ID=MMETSP0208-20121228/14460_1 /TAXON_ID=197538 /ORGANISM="Strombidium inclinatum, Strain S3" /LENGTH=73 /DNA_ID=CAMNT_0010770131 /DNA_START=676 /DNA_END=897 /DNA_ORIENTATION=+